MPRCLRVNATRVSWDFICLFKQTIPALWSFSPSYAVLGFQNVFYPPTSPSASRPTFPFSVLRPSIFAKSRFPYLTSAKAVSGCNTVKMVYNLSRNLVEPLRHKLHGSLRSVTYPEINVSRNVFVAVTVARSRTDFYFWQRLRQRKKNPRHVHFRACYTRQWFVQLVPDVATKLRDKLQEKLPSVTAALGLRRWKSS